MAVRQDASTGQLVDDGQALASPASDGGQLTMDVRVYSPFNTYFDEPAYSLSASNDTGPFDILPRHHNFISLLGACEVQIMAPGGNKRIRISGGLMHVKADAITIFLDV